MNTFNKIRREIDAHIPGTEINLARQKRKLERELRAQGYSRAAAVAIVSKRFAQHEKQP